MMKVCLVLIALVAVASCVPIKPAPKVDADVPCDVCLQVMDEGVNILLNEILNGGVVGGCDYLCHFLPEKYIEVGCNLLCDFVGIKEFVRIINQTDPDPIWYCQELHACPKVDGGSVTISSCTVTPSSGAIGTTFKVITAYTVNNATGPGLQTITLIPPGGGEPAGDANVDFGQAPGPYSLEWDIPSNSNFTAGQYGVQIQICEGDCLNKHPYSGVYAQSSTSFTITSQ
eukprot:Phypoly_transcript_18515.p1 GENE.Phypoly_transcript_18515~~Phypoly_transcript_18515.p1  ORF type:complete len:229 (+),score=30.82 Phypoly_transcript_18515:56-742(+)